MLGKVLGAILCAIHGKVLGAIHGARRVPLIRDAGKVIPSKIIPFSKRKEEKKFFRRLKRHEMI